MRAHRRRAYMRALKDTLREDGISVRALKKLMRKKGVKPTLNNMVRTVGLI